MKRALAILCVLGMLAAACGGDGDGDSVPTTAATTTLASTTTADGVAAPTTTPADPTDPRPSGPAFLQRGDEGPFVNALQHLLNCAGHGPIGTDGMFGDETAGAVAAAQLAEGIEATGEPDEETFASLSRACSEDRGVVFAAGSIAADVAGNAAPGDPDQFSLWVIEGQEMTIRVWSGATVDITVTGSDGVVLHPADGSAEIGVEVPSSQMYLIAVAAPDPTSYALTVEIPPLTSPGVEVDAILDSLLEQIAAGDIQAAMASISAEVIYHDANLVTHDSAVGTAALSQSLVSLSQGPGLISLGVSGRDGQLITFEASTVQEDPDLLLFAARVIGGAIVEWWDQPTTVEGALEAIFFRAQLGDIDGAMTLFDMEEVAYHRLDGATFEGAKGRAMVRQSFVESPPLVLVEIIEYTGARATFAVSNIAADPDAFFYTAQFNGGIGEWWEIAQP